MPSTSKQPFASIIIPTFNGGKRLEETLKSCLAIRSVQLEILLIDDGSTDGTPEHIVRTFPSVKLHRLQANSGSGSRGRNYGLELAKGRYVKFLDHDDLLQPRGFLAECKEALATDADVIISRWGLVSVDPQGRFEKSTLRIFTPPDPTRLVEAILLGEELPYTAAALYKRSYVGNEQWDPEATIIDDFDWFCRMALKGGKIIRIESISYYWRQHPNSIQGRSTREETLYKRNAFVRSRTYQKVDRILEGKDQLFPERRGLLARRYYDFLRCMARYDTRRCWLLYKRIHELDPNFKVDADYESDASSRRWIHAFGLPAFLIGYGLSRRLSDGAQQATRWLRA